MNLGVVVWQQWIWIGQQNPHGARGRESSKAQHDTIPLWETTTEPLFLLGLPIPCYGQRSVTIQKLEILDRQTVWCSERFINESITFTNLWWNDSQLTLIIHLLAQYLEIHGNTLSKPSKKHVALPSHPFFARRLCKPPGSFLLQPLFQLLVVAGAVGPKVHLWMSINSDHFDGMFNSEKKDGMFRGGYIPS